MPYKDPEARRKWWQNRRAEIRRVVQEGKSEPCADCGVQYPSYVMQYDHVRGSKEMTLGSATRNIKKLKVIREEMEKCEIVCANCHAERTHQRRGG